jgi:outer membrane protein assembly factor BamD (BamD/ComL family)
MYLIFKQSVMMEVLGVPCIVEMKELMKKALYFNSLATEEMQLGTLMSEGKNCIDIGNFKAATSLFEEAYEMEQWWMIYGSTILSSLAFAQSSQGNHIMALHYLEEYRKIFGDDAVNEDEQSKLLFVENQSVK